MGLTSSGSKKQAQNKRRVELVYEQLHRIICSYYGLALKLKVFTNPPTYHDQITMSLLQKNHPLRLPDSVLFPMFLGDELVAAAEVLGTRSLSENTFERLRQTIDLILTAKLESHAELQALRQFQERMEGALFPQAPNVVYLSDYRKDASPRVHHVALSRVTFNIPCLIQSSHLGDIQRMAVEVHEISNRYAFISLDDIDVRKLKAETLSDIGPVNIFIPELAHLSTSVQDIFVQYLQSYRTKLSPQILTGSVHSDSVLSLEFKISRNLIELLSTVTLEMTESFEHYKRTGIVNFFYDSMVKVPYT